MTDPRTVLAVADLDVTVDTTTILAGVDLTVGAGEIVGIAGESGSGKSALASCIAGDIAPTGGLIRVDGRCIAAPDRRRRPSSTVRDAAGPRIGIVWQTTEACGNIDVAANLMLGAESSRTARSAYRMRVAAIDLVERLGLDLPDVSRPMSSLTRSEAQLVAIARALRGEPTLIVLDDPTFPLGARDTAQVEALLAAAKRRGSAIVLISSDIHQLLRRCDRIVVLRRGHVVTEVDPTVTHADDLAALIAGERLATSARRQLVRIQGLADQLATTAGIKSGLPLILTVLGTALGTEMLCLHLVRGDNAVLASSAGLSVEQQSALATVPIGSGPIGRAAAGSTGRAGSDSADVGPTVVATGTTSASSGPSIAAAGPSIAAAGPSIAAAGESAPDSAHVAAQVSAHPAGPWLRDLGIGGGCVAVPITGSAGVLGVVTVFTPPDRTLTVDEVDLIGLYTGYAATTIEHERLLGEITARNRVLETIRSTLEVLSGPSTFDDALCRALGVLRDGTGAACVVLCEPRAAAPQVRWATDGATGLFHPDDAATDPALDPAVGAMLAAACAAALRAASDAATNGSPPTDGDVATNGSPPADGDVATFETSAGRGVLLACWPGGSPAQGRDLLADTAHFLSLAFERQDADRARQQAAALGRAEQLQRQFLARLSHELRTPLTAIRGYASSLTQPDVEWDDASERTFLTRISDESDRLGRLVGDLLDFSAMESGVLRLNLDWCALPLVLDAARACLPASAAERVTIRAAADIPAVWADHDRLEQVFVNLIGNAIRHNPPTTSVSVDISPCPAGVAITVSDDGVGLPVDSAGFDRDAGFTHLRSATSGSGLGLSIVRGIIEAHGGTVTAEPVTRGTRWRIVLPEESAASEPAERHRAESRTAPGRPARGSDDT